MQHGAIHRRAPFDMPMVDMEGPFLSQWSKVLWELENLALFHQAVERDITARNTWLDAEAERIRGSAPTGGDEDEQEFARILQSRRWTAIYDGELEVEAIARYADQLTVIGIWSLIEKGANRALTTLVTALDSRAAEGHRWSAVTAAFTRAGVDLTLLASHATVDECRRINNAIKHATSVGPALAAQPAFAAMAGMPIERVDLDVQRYLFGAGAFLGALLAAASQRIAKRS